MILEPTLLRPPTETSTLEESNTTIKDEPTINYSGGSDIRLADYLTELERRALRQQMLAKNAFFLEFHYIRHLTFY